MKIILISDTHSYHGFIKDLPLDADCIVHSGDISKRGTRQQVEDFLYWYKSLPYRYKIFIAGNHDFLFEDDPDLVKKLMPDNLIYLENSGVEIEGLKIYGSPISPWFHNWAFNKYRGSAIKKYWDEIPKDTNFLITHGPAYDILDKVNNYYNVEQNVGCHDLKNALFTLPNLKIFQFGHIHEARGYEVFNNIHCFNASCLNEEYCLHQSYYYYLEVTPGDDFQIKLL